jgi:hypothetical protein
MRAARALAIATVTVAFSLAASAAAAPTGLKFGSFPSRALQGDVVGVTVAVARAGDVCALGVKYADGSTQLGLSPHAVQHGQVAWTWKVPAEARTGPARVSVGCKSGKLSRPLMVVGAALPPKIDVLKQGFSVKTPKYGGDSVSYGVILANRSKVDDALDVSVLVNFVNASNVLIGSTIQKITLVRAGTEYALGNSMTFPGAAPVTRLEVVVRVGGRQPSAGPPMPVLDNVRIVPDTREPIWTGTVEGELSNRAPKLIMTSATVSAVVLDADGNVVGGGYGSVLGALPPGAREFFRLASGFTSIPTEKAKTVVYSIDPRFKEQAT